MLIELKDGDTVIIYGDVTFVTSDYYKNMTDALGRGLKDVKFFMASAPHESIVVYRSSPSPIPVDEHDGWFAWESAPQDGQFVDVWAIGYGRITDCFYRHEEWLTDNGDRELLNRFDEGTKLYWRYPPKGPKA